MNVLRKSYVILISITILLSAINSALASCSREEMRPGIGGKVDCQSLPIPLPPWYIQWTNTIILIIFIMIIYKFIRSGMNQYSKIKIDKNLGVSELRKQKQNVISLVIMKIILLILGCLIISVLPFIALYIL